MKYKDIDGWKISKMILGTVYDETTRIIPILGGNGI